MTGIWVNGGEGLMDSEGMNPDYDPGSLTFSQAQGYEELPRPIEAGGAAKRSEDAYLECVLFAH